MKVPLLISVHIMQLLMASAKREEFTRLLSCLRRVFFVDCKLIKLRIPSSYLSTASKRAGTKQVLAFFNKMVKVGPDVHR